MKLLIIEKLLKEDKGVYIKKMLDNKEMRMRWKKGKFEKKLVDAFFLKIFKHLGLSWMNER